MSDDIKDQDVVNEETIKKAIEVLKSVVSKFDDDKDFIERSGEERRKGLMAPYYRAFVKKMLENLSSAKMLMFFLPLWTSAFFLWVLFGMRDDVLEFAVKHPDATSDAMKFFDIAMNGFISWCTFTVSLGGTIIVVRETFKVSKLKALNSGDPEANKEIENMQN